MKQEAKKAYEVDISFHGNLTFYVDAENEEEAKDKAFETASEELSDAANLATIIFGYDAKEIH